MATDDFFHARLDGMVDPRHPLAVLGRRMPWSQIEASLAPLLAHKDRAGRAVQGEDLFGTTLQVAGGGVSNAGRPRLALRLMVALLYLKHAYNLSDEALVERFSENVVWQLFGGREYYDSKPPCDASQIGRFRRALGEQGVEQLLKTTVETAVTMGAVKHVNFQRVIVDTTVQEKAVAHPTDSRLLEVARAKITRLAQRAGLTLKQTFEREGRELRRRAGGYAHAKQFKRLGKVLRRQRTVLGRVLRDIQRKASSLSQEAQQRLEPWLERAQRIHTQRPKDKAKLYALHAPEVECIGKGKARQPYEFGVKTSLCTLHSHSLIVGARTFPGNPYDGHTLEQQLEQTATLLQDITLKGQAVKPSTVIADLGYRSQDNNAIAGVNLIHRGRSASLTQEQKRWLKRRQAIEPVIGHTKHDHGMKRCWLKGEQGDALHAVLCAAGFNIRWLMRAVLRKAQDGPKGLIHALSEWAAYAQRALLAVLKAAQIILAADHRMLRSPSALAG
jgi:transposase, IS5 family